MRNRIFQSRPLSRHKRSTIWRARLAATVLCATSLTCFTPGALRADGLHLAGETQSAKDAQVWLAADEQISMSPDQALWAALAFEDAEKVRAILDRGVNTNTPDELSHMTPLMAAETMPVATLLLERGADPRARDRTGRTALHYAVTMRDATKIIPLLVRKGADVDARTDDGNRFTPLMIAIENYIEVNDERSKTGFGLLIREFKHLDADVNAADARGKTPIAMAASRNQPELIRLLIDLGANPTQRLINGRTPLDYAREAGAQDAIQILAAATSSKNGGAN